MKAEEANEQFNDDNQFGEERFADVLGSDVDIDNLGYFDPEEKQ